MNSSFCGNTGVLGVGLMYSIMNDLKSENKSTAGERILNIWNGLQLLQLITQSMTQGSVGNKVGPKAVYARSVRETCIL